MDTITLAKTTETFMTTFTADQWKDQHNGNDVFSYVQLRDTGVKDADLNGLAPDPRVAKLRFYRKDTYHTEDGERFDPAGKRGEHYDYSVSVFIGEALSKEAALQLCKDSAQLGHINDSLTTRVALHPTGIYLAMKENDMTLSEYRQATNAAKAEGKEPYVRAPKK